jgi:AcrR family transcriptional regulator
VSSKIKPQPLPRGRHKLPPHVVRASQRDRLLAAMLESVAERGYEATTVPDVVAAARVSRNAFYELFGDKLECFLALCDQAAAEVLDTLLAQSARGDWLEALRSGTALYLRWWQERPAFSRAYLVELPSAGPRAIEQRDRAYARFREMYEGLGRWARVEHPGLAPLDPIVPRMLVVAITELVAEEVRAGRVGHLVELEDQLVALMARLLAA